MQYRLEFPAPVTIHPDELFQQFAEQLTYFGKQDLSAFLLMPFQWRTPLHNSNNVAWLGTLDAGKYSCRTAAVEYKQGYINAIRTGFEVTHSSPVEAITKAAEFCELPLAKIEHRALTIKSDSDIQRYDMVCATLPLYRTRTKTLLNLLF